MASVRSTQRAQSATPTDSPKQALAALARSAARTQIAACSAAVTSFAGWARAIDQLAQAVGDDLLRRIENETDSAELVAGVTKATSSHLRDLAALPRIATEHFDARLARVPNDI
jgi:hypothetical protein